MKYMTGNEIREKFLKFFEDRGHLILPSASLIPQDDRRAFDWLRSGPFKPFFTGKMNRLLLVLRPAKNACVQAILRMSAVLPATILILKCLVISLSAIILKKRSFPGAGNLLPKSWGFLLISCGLLSIPKMMSFCNLA